MLQMEFLNEADGKPPLLMVRGTVFLVLKFIVPFIKRLEVSNIGVDFVETDIADMIAIELQNAHTTEDVDYFWLTLCALLEEIDPTHNWITLDTITFNEDGYTFTYIRKIDSAPEPEPEPEPVMEAPAGGNRRWYAFW
jgi:hypothetical protein